MRARRRYSAVAAGLLAAAGPAAVTAQQVTAELEMETRVFPRSPLFATQARNAASLRFQPELYLDADRGRTTFTVEPFVRLDATDGRRSHVDLRELSFVRAWEAIEIRAGIRTVFWGVTESQHLVDVINQTDLVENLDGEDKLGQPMVNVALIRAWGQLQLFLMPWFRERTFPGREGRLRFPLPVSGRARYPAGVGRRHLDWALRWSHALGAWDVGISHFSGINREPRFTSEIDAAGQPQLVPHYDLTDQTGIDVQHTRGSWLFKFEGISRTEPGDRLYALTTGFEYTLYGVLGTAADLGLIAEYLWDSRGAAATTPFENDVAAGTRVAFNDTWSSQLLAVAIVDASGDGSFISVQGDRRLGSDWRVGLEARGFVGIRSQDPLYTLRKDAYLELTITRFF